MTGKVAPDIVKPVPVNVAELMVTGAVPLELSVTGSVVGVFTVTLPNAKLAGLMLSVGTAAFSCRAKVFDTPPALAVRVTACAGRHRRHGCREPRTGRIGRNHHRGRNRDRRAAASQAHTHSAAPRSRAQRHRAAIAPGSRQRRTAAGKELNVPATAVPVPLSPITAVPLVDELLWMVS